jgi:hypothetical protein
MKQAADHFRSPNTHAYQLDIVELDHDWRRSGDRSSVVCR